LQEKEDKYAKAKEAGHRKWTEHTRKKIPLKVGHQVLVQNLAGNHPLKWDRTGTVVVVLQNDQYKIRVDGSNRVTLRNRKHLRIIGYQKSQNPFPISSVPTVTGGERVSVQSDQGVTNRYGGQDVQQTPENLTEGPEFHTSTGSREEPLVMKTVPSFRIAKTADNQPTPLVMDAPDLNSPKPTTPSRISRLTPRGTMVEVQPTIHRELRDFNRPGLKERVID